MWKREREEKIKNNLKKGEEKRVREKDRKNCNDLRKWDLEFILISGALKKQTNKKKQTMTERKKRKEENRWMEEKKEFRFCKT